MWNELKTWWKLYENNSTILIVSLYNHFIQNFTKSQTHTSYYRLSLLHRAVFSAKDVASGDKKHSEKSFKFNHLRTRVFTRIFFKSAFVCFAFVFTRGIFVRPFKNPLMHISCCWPERGGQTILAAMSYKNWYKRKYNKFHVCTTRGT